MVNCKNQTLSVLAISQGFFEFVNISKKLLGVKGRDFEILQVLSIKMQFQYELMTPDDQQWGNCDDKGHCTGMIGMLARHKADMAISQISYSEIRAKHADFSYPYLLDEATFATKNIDAYKEVNNKVFFVEPFHRQVWIFLASLLVIFLSVVKILDYFELSRTKMISVPTMLPIILRQSVNLQRNKDKLSYVMALLVLVVTGGCTCKLYECVLTSATSLTPIIPPIDTISDMVDAIRNRNYVISAPQGTVSYELIMRSEMEYLKIFAQSTLDRNFVAPKTTEEGIEMVLNSEFALVNSRSSMNMIQVKQNQPSKTFHCAKEYIFLDHIAVATRRHFPCRDDLDKWLNVLVGSGLIGKWHSEDLRLFNQSTTRNEAINATYISTSDLRLIFATLVFGYLAGFVSLLMENIKKHFQTRNFIKPVHN